MRTVVLSATRPGVLGASVRLACPLALVLAVACSSSSTPPAGSALSPDAVRFLEQSTFGPTEALAASLQDAGFAGFVDAQFAASASSLGTYPVVLQPPAVVCPLSAPSNCYRDNFTRFSTGGAVLSQCARGRGPTPAAGGLRAQPNLRGERRRGEQHLRNRRLRAALVERCVLQLPADPPGRHAQSGHGPVPQHGEQRQGQPHRWDTPQRELRAGAPAALLHWPGQAERRMGRW